VTILLGQSWRGTFEHLSGTPRKGLDQVIKIGHGHGPFESVWCRALACNCRPRPLINGSPRDGGNEQSLKGGCSASPIGSFSQLVACLLAHWCQSRGQRESVPLPPRSPSRMAALRTCVKHTGMVWFISVPLRNFVGCPGSGRTVRRSEPDH